jgi:hypothetical protein
LTRDWAAFFYKLLSAFSGHWHFNFSSNPDFCVHFTSRAMMVEDESSMQSLAAALLNKTGHAPLSVRFRALFALKALAGEGSAEAVDIIAKG